MSAAENKTRLQESRLFHLCSFRGLTGRMRNNMKSCPQARVFPTSAPAVYGVVDGHIVFERVGAGDVVVIGVPRAPDH